MADQNTPVLVPNPVPEMLAPAPTEQVPVEVSPGQFSPVLPPAIVPASPVAITDPAQQQAIANYVQPPAPVDAPILPPEALAALPEPAAQALTTPTTEQVAAEFQKLALPYQQEKARLNALDKVDKMYAEADLRQKAREEQLQQKLNAIDNRVRTKSLAEIFQSGSVGSKLGAAIAVLAGGVSQGLTGAKSNPVLDYMDRLVEQQATKDKLSIEEKEALRKQVYEQGQNEIKRLEGATQNAYRKDQLNMMNQELELKKQELLGKLTANVAAQIPADMYSGRELTKEETLKAKANKDLSPRLVTLPNGKAFIANSSADASQFKSLATESLNALSLLEAYRKIGVKGSAFSLTDRAQAAALRQAIVGALRLPFTGPGPLIKEEREMLIKTLGDPLALTTLRPIELAKIDKVMDALKVNTINKARLSGVTGELFPEKYYNINGRAVREDKLIQMYRAKLPNLSDEQIKAAMAKSIPGL